MFRLNFQLALIWTQRHITNCLCVFILLSLGSNPFTLAQTDPLANMPLEQRVAQMFIVNLYGSQLTEAGHDFLTKWQPSGLVLLPENITSPKDVTRLTNVY